MGIRDDATIRTDSDSHSDSILPTPERRSDSTDHENPSKHVEEQSTRRIQYRPARVQQRGDKRHHFDHMRVHRGE